VEGHALSKRRALVIGGSVGGLFTALLLSEAGWHASVFERAPGNLGDRGTGIGTRADLFAVMRRVGVEAYASIGVDVLGRTGLGRDGRSTGTAHARGHQRVVSRLAAAPLGDA
jgi:2-polyprenyl-6-methoxyphenol hydroxylase-like FAD-dependent oxidoreductase